jgi:SAM-dependent methyltransferase
MNKILTNDDRNKYFSLIEDMKIVCPEMMKRKIAGANVQQAFVVDTVLKLHKKDDDILCVGCFEDTAYEYLRKGGMKIIGIDPEIDIDLAAFKKTTLKKWDIIFSTSVIEHVKDDEQFITDICDLLHIGGKAILTCDFKDGWKNGDKLIGGDFRFYTCDDLNIRLGNLIKKQGCELLSQPNWIGPPDFHLCGFDYNFATFTFVKNK